MLKIRIWNMASVNGIDLPQCFGTNPDKEGRKIKSAWVESGQNRNSFRKTLMPGPDKGAKRTRRSRTNFMKKLQTRLIQSGQLYKTWDQGSWYCGSLDQRPDSGQHSDLRWRAAYKFQIIHNRPLMFSLTSVDDNTHHRATLYRII